MRIEIGEDAAHMGWPILGGQRERALLDTFDKHRQIIDRHTKDVFEERPAG